ncbi:high mobility group protein DSP1-like [Oppia nitens]|uniref:high mobility group protein DSP1-like n=1 Tax=Oppia nitens TaxID=1686743 RepID=UPI0023DA7682|nr:high mobility group protein DSP1-like [Oppia nitens]
MGKIEGKPRGRMSAYAYFVQTCREEHKKKHPNENVVFAEFSKKCAERWKTMNDKEKNRFHVLAEKDKKRYDGEMLNYKPPKGEKGRKRKRTKDPNAPKRALSAFFWFCNDERPKVKETMNDATVGEVAKELGRRWNEHTEDMKSKFEALAAKDKARYEKEMKVYKAKKAKPVPVKVVPKKEESEDEDEEEEEEEEDEDEDDD